VKPEKAAVRGSIFLAIILFCASYVSLLTAQDEFTVKGNAHDSSGAVIPGAVISVEGPETGKSKTDAEGNFLLWFAAPGKYAFRVESEGFVPAELSVTLSDEHPTETLDVVLGVAAGSQTVEVTADALTAETTSTQIGEVLAGRTEMVP
jgi:hypothetical protein